MVTSTVSWRLAEGVRRPRRDVLLGGSPWRALRLSASATRQLDDVLAGREHPRITAALRERGVLIAKYPPAHSVEDVTVVIPTTNTMQNLRCLVAAVPAECAIIVVNDGEHGGEPIDERTTVIRTPAPFSGPSVARNLGLAAVSTPFVAFLDDDVTVAAAWLRTLRGAFADDRISLVAGRVRSSPGTGIAGYLERQACALDMGDRSGPVGVNRSVSYVPSAAFMARTEAIAGGFDVALTVGEDVDLVWRMGEGVEYIAEVVAWHAPRRTIRAVLRRRFAYGTSAAALDRRHPGELHHLVLSTSTALPWLGLLTFGWKGTAAAAGASLAAGTRSLSKFPLDVAVETTLRAQLHSAHATSRAAVRPYWPVTLAASVMSRRFRRRVLPAIALGYATNGGNAATFIDDLAYGTGVWWGCLRSGNVRPLIPRFRR